MRFRNPIYNSMGLVRKRPAASVRSPLNVGLASRRPFYPGSADCPEAGKTISFENCLACPKFAVWHEQDGDFKRCWYEFKSLESRGYYDGTWNDHPENFANEPEVFEKIQARKRLNEEFAADFEREKAELARLAEELAQKSSDDRSDDFYWLNDDYDGDEEDEEAKDDLAEEEEDDDGHY